MIRVPLLQDRLAVRTRPGRSPVMFQTWSDLLFLHWEITADEIAKRIPDGLTVDLHEGKTYLGLVPFFMKKVRPRFLPAVPWLSNFMEMNIRAYVHDAQGRPGVWFFSLDCNQPIAVELARKFFHLPYQHARMLSKGSQYRCLRKGEADEAVFDYPVDGEVKSAKPGSLEFFLLERYLLFSESRSGSLHCGRVHHDPYPFCDVELTKLSKAPLHWEGFELEGAPVSALMSPGVKVNIFPLESLK